MPHQVELKKSGKKTVWNDRYESILELAEANGVEIDNDCRQGYCGSCMVKLLSGEVEMSVDDALTDSDRENGMILSCSATPTSDIVIDI